jgi:hypothetical protein
MEANRSGVDCRADCKAKWGKGCRATRRYFTPLSFHVGVFMIVRDGYKLIVQPGKDNPKWLDGGDTPRATGLMAMCGSEQDINNMFTLTDGGELVRHPYQETNTGTHPHNDHRSVSRDQLMCYAAGLLSIQRPTRLHSAVHNYASKWFINNDFLSPDVRLMLYKACKNSAPIHIVILGYFQAFLTLIWHTKIRPDEEKNQVIAQMAVMGDWWIKKLFWWHPNLGTNLNEYWGGWRGQPEIAETIFRYIYDRVWGDSGKA